MAKENKKSQKSRKVNTKPAKAPAKKQGSKKKVSSSKKKKDDDDCFITTAVVKHYGLQDDCSYLQVLRNFRDNYLVNLPEGKEMVKNYYRIGPSIVSALERNEHKEFYYSNILISVQITVDAISHHKYDLAIKTYYSCIKELVATLK